MDVSTMATDPRTDYEKLNRREIIRILNAKGIQHPNFCKKSQGIKLLEANNINPREAIEWTQITVLNERGDEVVKHVPKRTVPKRPEGYDERVQAEMDKITQDIIEKEAAEKARKDSEIGDLKSQVAQLTALVEKLTQSKPVGEPKMGDLRKRAKELDITVPFGAKKDDIIQLIKEKEDGNTA